MNKILAICTSPDRGGLELYFTKFVEHYYRKKNSTSLHAVVRKNSYISQTLKKFGNSNRQKEISKISIINLIFYAIYLAKYVNNHNIDFIHISWGKDLLLSVFIKIFTTRKVHIIYYRQMKLSREKKDIYHKFIYKNISIILAITENLKNECNNFLPVSNHIIKKLPYGIEEYQNLQTPIMSKEELCKDFNWDLSSFTIGVFSRLEEQKGQHLVVKAMRELAPLNISLGIIGHCMDEKYKKRLIEEISSYNLTNKVRLENFMEQPMRVMSGFDLIVLPTYEETFGLVAAEAMMMGVPVIGSNAGGIPEIIKDNVNGLLFETKNSNSLKQKISMMINSLELRQKLSNNAKIFIREHYNYDKHFESFDGFLNEL